MKRIFISSLALLLCAALLFVVAPAEVSAATIASGDDGWGTSWTLTDDGTLTVTGEGTLYCEWDSSYAASIKKVVINPGITALGSSLFNGYENLTTVSLPSTLTEIGSAAFYGCTKLASVSLPSTLTSIGSSAFKGCESLTTITIPSGVETLGAQTFKGCTKLTSVSLPSTLTEIGSYAFNGCESLTTITIPSGVETLGDYTFSGCTNLASVSLPSTLTSIGSYAFYGCTKLASVSLPSTLTEIGAVAFYGCESLTSITIPNGIEAIDSSTFAGCTKLASVSLPSTLTEIGSCAFRDCGSLTSITIPNSVEVIGYGAFEDCDGLQSVVIPASVTSIGGYAFEYCYALRTVTFCGDMPAFDDCPFYYVTAFCYYPVGNTTYADAGDLGGTLVWVENGKDLTGTCGSRLSWSLTNEGVLTITSSGNKKAAMPDFDSYGDNMAPWSHARKLITSVVIGEGINRIGNNAFYNCTNLTSVTLPSTLVGIGGSAFAYCENLTAVELPGTLNSIGSSAFYDCDSLTAITIPKSVTTIGSSAFSNTGLKAVSIPNSVTNLGYSAFENCKNLKSATISGSVGYLSSDLFSGCEKLTKVTLGSGITSIGSYAFYGCTALETITIPESVSELGYSAFMNCESLTSITLPRNVSYIGSSAFKNCFLLKSVNIPAGVTTINSHTFYECASLETVYFTGDAPTSIDTEAFLNVYATVYYPKGNTTWTSAMRKDYGGVLTWKSQSMPKLKILKAPETYIHAANGKSAKVTIKAEGEDLQYTWYYYDNETGKFKVTKSFTGNYYKVTMNPARDGRIVYCVITDKYGNRYQSDWIHLYMVEEALQITQQPKGVAVANGKTAKVTVKAEGEGLKYTWYVKDAGKTEFTKSSITKSTYSVKMTAARSGRQVYCVVSDKNGNEVVSNTVTISRITITKQPKGDVGKSNERVSATVKATGDGIKYQWYVKDAGKTKFSKSSVTKATYGYNMTTAKSGRQAYCVITDKYGNSVTTDTITFSRLYIKTQPKSVKVASGTSAKVTVRGVGEDLTYTWYVKDPGKSSFTKSSITKSSYSVKMNSSRNGRQVYCVITDAYGNTVRTETVTLRIK